MLGFTGKNILRRPMQNTNLIVNLNLSLIKNRTVSCPLSAPQKVSLEIFRKLFPFLLRGMLVVSEMR